MKKHICLALICIITVFSVCTTALADINTEIDSQTCRLNAQIFIEGAENKKAAIEVFNPGKTPDDTVSISPKGVMTVFDYIKEDKFDASGRLVISYTLDGESGFYSVRVSPEGMEPVMYPNAFLFVSPQFEAEFLENYCQSDATNESRLELIESNYDIIEIDINNMLGFNTEQKLSIVEFMGNDFETLDGLKNAYASAIVAHSIKNLVSWKTTDNLFNEYQNELGDVSSVFGIYELYVSDNDKEDFYKSFDASKLGNFNDFTTHLSDRIILYSLKCLNNHQEVENIIKMSEGYLEEDFSDYYGLTDKKNVNLELTEEDFASCKDFAQRVHKLSEKNKPQKKPQSSGGGSSSGSFSGPSLNVTVPPSIVNSNASGEVSTGVFEDIADYQWAQAAINTLCDRGVLNGVSENRFEPQRQINREEFTKLVVEAFFSADNNYATDFQDVSSTHWCYPYVATACKLGIINGVSSTEFGVGKPISRQDMAVILYRAVNIAGIELPIVQSVSFNDAFSLSAYATEAVTKISQWGIINGFEDGSFAPLKSATRAESAKIIYETLTKGGALDG